MGAVSLPAFHVPERNCREDGASLVSLHSPSFELVWFVTEVDLRKEAEAVGSAESGGSFPPDLRERAPGSEPCDEPGLPGPVGPNWAVYGLLPWQSGFPCFPWGLRVAEFDQA